MSAPNDSEERQLEQLAKRLLAMPHKPRDESKIGKSKAKGRKSPRKRKAPPKRG